MLNIIIYLVVAAIIGWVATELMHDRSNLLINIIVAVIGGFIAGYFLTPLFHISPIGVGAISIPAMLITLAGAVILLFIVNLIRRRR
ncbi:MAG: GlsB/YeaQ/YmgE family stress response membrane protein [Anaerolineales bacterium]